MKNDKRIEIRERAAYLRGMASTHNDNMAKNVLMKAAADLDTMWLSMCNQGYIGCHGDNCTSDHK